MENLSFRTAEPADEEFLQELFFDVRRDEFEAVGMPLENLKPLMSMQYSAQKRSFRAAFPLAEDSIIESGGEKIGRIMTAVIDEDATHLIDVAVLRNRRSRGVGSYFLEKLKAENKKVSLAVYKSNDGAIRLYERHGFKIVSEDGMYYRMEWKNA